MLVHNTCGKVTAKKAKTSKPSSGTGKYNVVKTDVGAALATYDTEFAVHQLLVGGETTEELLRSIVPKEVSNTFVSSATISDGYKYNFLISGKKVEIKWHSTDLNAASKYVGSNSGSGWTAQVKVGKKLLGQDGNFYKKPGNITHIPLRGGSK